VASREPEPVRLRCRKTFIRASGIFIFAINNYMSFVCRGKKAHDLSHVHKVHAKHLALTLAGLVADFDWGLQESVKRCDKTFIR